MNTMITIEDAKTAIAAATRTIEEFKAAYPTERVALAICRALYDLKFKARHGLITVTDFNASLNSLTSLPPALGRTYRLNDGTMSWDEIMCPHCRRNIKQWHPMTSGLQVRSKGSIDSTGVCEHCGRIVLAEVYIAELGQAQAKAREEQTDRVSVLMVKLLDGTLSTLPTVDPARVLAFIERNQPISREIIFEAFQDADTQELMAALCFLVAKSRIRTDEEGRFLGAPKPVGPAPSAPLRPTFPADLYDYLPPVYQAAKRAHRSTVATIAWCFSYSATTRPVSNDEPFWRLQYANSFIYEAVYGMLARSTDEALPYLMQLAVTGIVPLPATDDVANELAGELGTVNGLVFRTMPEGTVVSLLMACGSMEIERTLNEYADAITARCEEFPEAMPLIHSKLESIVHRAMQGSITTTAPALRHELNALVIEQPQTGSRLEVTRNSVLTAETWCDSCCHAPHIEQLHYVGDNDDYRICHRCGRLVLPTEPTEPDEGPCDHYVGDSWPALGQAWKITKVNGVRSTSVATWCDSCAKKIIYGRDIEAQVIDDRDVDMADRCDSCGCYVVHPRQDTFTHMSPKAQQGIKTRLEGLAPGYRKAEAERQVKEIMQDYRERILDGREAAKKAHEVITRAEVDQAGFFEVYGKISPQEKANHIRIHLDRLKEHFQDNPRALAVITELSQRGKVTADWCKVSDDLVDFLGELSCYDLLTEIGSEQITWRLPDTPAGMATAPASMKWELFCALVNAGTWGSVDYLDADRWMDEVSGGFASCPAIDGLVDDIEEMLHQEQTRAQARLDELADEEEKAFEAAEEARTRALEALVARIASDPNLTLSQIRERCQGVLRTPEKGHIYDGDGFADMALCPACSNHVAECRDWFINTGRVSQPTQCECCGRVIY